MSRAQIVLNGDDAKGRAIAWVRKAPWNSRIEFKPPKRSVDQNDKMWAALTDIATQLSYHGQKLNANDWKKLFLAELKQEMRLVPNLSNNGFVNLGNSSSDLGKDEMSDLITIIIAWGATHGVVFQDQKERENA